MIRNCFLCSKSCVVYSRNKLNGGLVTTMSDCLSNSTHSALLKSPSLSRGVHSLCLLVLSCFEISSSVKEPSPSTSPTSLIMNLLAVIFERPFDLVRVLSSPNNPNCVLATGEGL